MKPYLGASPDGILKNNLGINVYCIEIKCPYNARSFFLSIKLKKLI